MAAKKPKQHKLRIELGASASPERVAMTATMFADAIKAIDPALGESVTMVVNNFELRAEVRGLSATGNKLVQQIGDVIEHPDRSLAKAKHTKLPEVASILARGLEQLGDIDTSLFWGSKKSPFKRASGKAIASDMKDAAKRAMKSIAEAPSSELLYQTGERRMRTSFYTPIIRFGRATESAKVRQVRIVVFGNAMEVDVPPDLQTVCANLSTTDDRYRVSIVARWVRRNGKNEIDDVKLVGIDPNDRAMTSKDFIERIKENADAFSDGLDQLREQITELRSE